MAARSHTRKPFYIRDKGVKNKKKQQANKTKNRNNTVSQRETALTYFALQAKRCHKAALL